MGTIGLSEVMASSANFGKLSEKPVRVDAINHKVIPFFKLNKVT